MHGCDAAIYQVPAVLLLGGRRPQRTPAPPAAAPPDDGDCSVPKVLSLPWGTEGGSLNCPQLPCLRQDLMAGGYTRASVLPFPSWLEGELMEATSSCCVY